MSDETLGLDTSDKSGHLEMTKMLFLLQQLSARA